MSERDTVRDMLFEIWKPAVLDHLGDGQGYSGASVEYQILRFGGEVPDPGFPPEWPKAVTVLEREINRLPRDLREVLLYEVGIRRDEHGYRYRIGERAKALHVSRAKYYSMVYAALSALWQSQEVRDIAAGTI